MVCNFLTWPVFFRDFVGLLLRNMLLNILIHILLIVITGWCIVIVLAVVLS
jgi:hypothetical protein